MKLWALASFVVIIAALLCLAPRAEAGSTKQYLGVDLPDAGLLVLNKTGSGSRFSSAQPIFSSTTAVTSEIPATNFTGNMSGNTGTQSVLVPGAFSQKRLGSYGKQAVANPYTTTTPQNVVTPVVPIKAEPFSPADPYGNSITTNDNRGGLDTSLGAQRAKYLQSSEGAAAQRYTQPDMKPGGGSDIRTANGTAVPGWVDGSMLTAWGWSNKDFWASWPSSDVVDGWSDKKWLTRPFFPENDVTVRGDFMKDVAILMQKRSLENDPQLTGPRAAAEGQAQALGAGNSAADMSRNQAASAITFVGSYLVNFTVDGSNKWNKIRDQIFVPMAILLLLPGAVLAQAKAIVASGMPVLGDVNPFEGITRSIIAVFLIPGTYLVINYGLDVCNSITYTISSEYQRLFGTNMYQDAICAEIRATPVRKPENNRNALDSATFTGGTPILGLKGAFHNLKEGWSRMPFKIHA